MTETRKRTADVLRLLIEWTEQDGGSLDNSGSLTTSSANVASRPAPAVNER